MKHPKVIWRRLGALLRSASSAAVPEATWKAYKAAGSKAYKQGMILPHDFGHGVKLPAQITSVSDVR